MGFRKGSYARVWEVQPVSDTNTKIRITISRKDKLTEEYIDEFSGFVACIGTAAAKRAANLQKGDRIKLGDVDVTTRYVKETKTLYTNFKCFNFEDADAPSQTPPSMDNLVEGAQANVDNGEPSDNRLPF